MIGRGLIGIKLIFVLTGLSVPNGSAHAQQKPDRTDLDIMMEQMREFDEETDKIMEEFFRDDAFSGAQDVFDDFDRAQREFFQRLPQSQLPPAQMPGTARHDGIAVTQEDVGDRVLVRVKIPGLDENSVTIKVDEQTIDISGASVGQKAVAQGGMTQQNTFSNRFQRRFPLPAGVDSKGLDVKKFSDEIVLSFPKFEI